jgi:hypothetical protein
MELKKYSQDKFKNEVIKPLKWMFSPKLKEDGLNYIFYREPLYEQKQIKQIEDINDLSLKVHILYYQEDYIQAINLLQNFLKNNKDPELYYMLYVISSRLYEIDPIQKWDELAINSLKKSLEINPTKRIALISYIQELMIEGLMNHIEEWIIKGDYKNFGKQESKEYYYNKILPQITNLYKLYKEDPYCNFHLILKEMNEKKSQKEIKNKIKKALDNIMIGYYKRRDNYLETIEDILYIENLKIDKDLIMNQNMVVEPKKAFFIAEILEKWYNISSEGKFPWLEGVSFLPIESQELTEISINYMKAKNYIKAKEFAAKALVLEVEEIRKDPKKIKEIDGTPSILYGITKLRNNELTTEKSYEDLIELLMNTKYLINENKWENVLLTYVINLTMVEMFLTTKDLEKIDKYKPIYMDILNDMRNAFSSFKSIIIDSHHYSMIAWMKKLLD